MKAFNDWLQFVSPILLYFLLEVLENGNPDGNGGLNDGKVLAALMFTAMSVKTLIENHYFHRMFRLGMHLQASLILKVSASHFVDDADCYKHQSFILLVGIQVYNKALRLSVTSRQSRTIGEIVKYVSIIKIDSRQHCAADSCI